MGPAHAGARTSRPLGRFAVVLGQRLLCLRDDGAERLAFVHGDVGKHLAIEIDPGELQRVDELAVSQPLGSDRGVDPLDPQGAEAALLHLAVAVCVLAGLLDGLAGDSDGVLAAAVIALRILEDPLVLGARRHAALDACHGSRSLVETVRRPELHPRRIGVGKHSGTAVLADIFGIVADEAVSLANNPVLELAGGRELEALLDAALGLELGHFRLLCAFAWNATLSNRHGMPSGRAI